MNHAVLKCQNCCSDFAVDQPLKLPKLLSCGHTFCAGCIEKSIEDGTTFQCPVCNRTHPSTIRVSELGNNIIKMEILVRKEPENIEQKTTPSSSSTPLKSTSDMVTSQASSEIKSTPVSLFPKAKYHVFVVFL